MLENHSKKKISASKLIMTKIWAKKKNYKENNPRNKQWINCASIPFHEEDMHPKTISWRKCAQKLFHKINAPHNYSTKKMRPETIFHEENMPRNHSVKKICLKTIPWRKYAQKPFPGFSFSAGDRRYSPPVKGSVAGNWASKNPSFSVFNA